MDKNCLNCGHCRQKDKFGDTRYFCYHCGTIADTSKPCEHWCPENQEGPLPPYEVYEHTGDDLAAPLTEWIDGSTRMVFTYRADPNDRPFVVMWRQEHWIPINILIWASDEGMARARFKDYLDYKRRVVQAYMQHHRNRIAKYGPDSNSEWHIHEAEEDIHKLDTIDFAKEAMIRPLRMGRVYSMDWSDDNLHI